MRSTIEDRLPPDIDQMTFDLHIQAGFKYWCGVFVRASKDREQVHRSHRKKGQTKFLVQVSSPVDQRTFLKLRKRLVIDWEADNRLKKAILDKIMAYEDALLKSRAFPIKIT
jgi:hypothetical protein